MTYVMIKIREDGIRLVMAETKGTVSLEKYTDRRIVNIYKGKVDLIYKRYEGSRVTLLYGKEYYA